MNIPFIDSLHLYGHTHTHLYQFPRLIRLVHRNYHVLCRIYYCSFCQIQQFYRCNSYLFGGNSWNKVIKKDDAGKICMKAYEQTDSSQQNSEQIMHQL